MAYVDPQTVHNPSVGATIPAAWGDAVRAACQYLANPPAVVLNGAASTCPNNTFTDLAVSTEVVDTAGMHTGTDRFVTVPDDGLYVCNGVVEFAADPAGLRTVDFYVNGALSAVAAQIPATASSACTVAGSRVMPLAAGDTVAIRGRQNTGGALDATCREFSVRWVSLG